MELAAFVVVNWLVTTGLLACDKIKTNTSQAGAFVVLSVCDVMLYMTIWDLPSIEVSRFAGVYYTLKGYMFLGIGGRFDFSSQASTRFVLKSSEIDKDYDDVEAASLRLTLPILRREN